MNKYRSLAAWQHAHALLINTLKATDGRNPARTWNLFDQIRRAAISVEANIVEGYALSTAPQFKRHLKIALASAAEAETLLNAATELGYLPEACTENLLAHADRAIGAIYGLLRSPKLRSSR